MMSRIQRYILKECLISLAMVLGIFVIAIMLVDVVEQLRTVGGDTDISTLQAVQLSTLKLPMLIEQTFPIAILVAVMIAFTRMNRRSELSIIRASGLSAWRFLTPVALLSLGLGILTMTGLNPLGAQLSGSFEQARAKLLNSTGPAVTVSDTGIWLRQGNETRQIVIHADQIEEAEMILTNVKFIEEERLFIDNKPSDDFAFVRRIDASKAQLFNGFWQLENVIENLPNQPPIRRESLAIPTTVQASTLLDKFASPNTIGFWGLPKYMRQTKLAGLDAARYEMRWSALTATPILFLCMGLLGAIVCLRLARLGGTAQLLAMGGIVATSLFFITQLSSSLGSTGAVPPMVAAWAPALCVLFGIGTFLAFKEDG